MKAIPCTVIVNTRFGHVCAPYNAKSISDGLRYAKTSGAFAYRIVVGEMVVKSGYC